MRLQLTAQRPAIHTGYNALEIPSIPARARAATGCRKSEGLNLRWRQIDIRAGTVTLDPGTTKPIDVILKFVDADITSQQLIDGSIVLLNGDRMQVSLAVG